MVKRNLHHPVCWQNQPSLFPSAVTLLIFTTPKCHSLLHGFLVSPNQGKTSYPTLKNIVLSSLTSHMRYLKPPSTKKQTQMRLLFVSTLERSLSVFFTLRGARQADGRMIYAQKLVWEYSIHALVDKEGKEVFLSV